MKWRLYYRYPHPAVPWMEWDGAHGGDWHKLRNIAQHLAADPVYKGVITRIEPIKEALKAKSAVVKVLRVLDNLTIPVCVLGSAALIVMLEVDAPRKTITAGATILGVWAGCGLVRAVRKCGMSLHEWWDFL